MRPADAPVLELADGLPDGRPPVTVPVRPPAGTDPVAALALVLRRWTGVPTIPLAVRAGGRLGVLAVDLAGDPPARVAPAAVAAGLADPGALPPPAGPVEVEVLLGPAAAAPGGTRVGPGGVLGPAAGGPGALVLAVGPAGVTLSAPEAMLGRARLRQLGADLATVAAEVAADPGRPVSTLLARSALAAGGSVRPLPGPAADFPAAALEGSLVARFTAVADRHPDLLAVHADDGRLTYAELARAAAGVEAAVRGATPGRVGLLLDSGAAMVTALLGVLAAGHAYVPLDPAYPVDRLAAVLAHAEPSVLLTTAAHRELAARLGRVPVGRVPVGRVPVGGVPVGGVPVGGVPVLEVDRLAPGDRLGDAAGPDSAAYVLYTSGSTGRPKGVVQNHRNVLFQARHHARTHRVSTADRLSVLSSFGFDMAVTDTFTALLTGAAAVPVDVRRHGLGHLAAALRERGVTVYHSTPTLYRHWLASLDGPAPAAVRVVLLGGEEVTRRDVELHRARFAPGSTLVNGYGATEISFALQHQVGAGSDLTVVPVGRPLPGVQVLLLDPDGREAWLTGEIAVRSRHVAVGYWRPAAADAARFTEIGGVRAYRTGDLGRRLPDGTIRCLGRRDRQVKVRGYRVELAEVEEALARQPGVAEAVAVAREAPDGTREVLGYVVGGAGPAELRRALEAELPHFAVPRAVVAVDAFPLTATGKVDTRALPAPAVPTGADRPGDRPGGPVGENPGSENPGSADPGSADPGSADPGSADPDGADPVRLVIAAAWCEVLGLPAVPPDVSFFALGGHSLQLAAVQSRVEAALGRGVPMHRMLRYPTVAALAGVLARPDAPAHGSGGGAGSAGSGEGSGAGPDDALGATRDRMARRRRTRTGGDSSGTGHPGSSLERQRAPHEKIG